MMMVKSMDKEINCSANPNTNRVETIDALKGIGILLMVLGHMHFSIMFNHYIFAFHMPLFFMISGYLYKRPESMVKTISKKARSLLIPYFSFGFGYWLLWFLVNMKEDVDLFAPLWALLLHGTDGLVLESALWFLPTLFVAYILFSAIDRKIVRTTYKTALIVFFTVIGCITTGMLYTSENMGGGVL